MKKTLFIAIVFLKISSFSFGQNPPADSNPNSSTQPHKGITFNYPAGSWTPIPPKKSLLPYMDYKVQEQTETDKKVTVVYQTVGANYDVPSLFDQVKSVFGLNWDGLSLVQKVSLISPSGEETVGGPRKFNALYRIVEKITQTSFRVEVVVVSGFDMRGNKGILYIISPEYNYYENRFFIKSIRDALVLDVNAVVSDNKTQEQN